jgi:ABC transporter substrate binding protein
MTVRHAVPADHGRSFAAAGGLLSYGGDVADAYRSTGIYVGRVLKGEKPADLPVQQATKVELYINLKTAKALGITVPLPLSGRADVSISHGAVARSKYLMAAASKSSSSFKRVSRRPARYPTACARRFSFMGQYRDRPPGPKLGFGHGSP